MDSLWLGFQESWTQPLCFSLHTPLTPAWSCCAPPFIYRSSDAGVKNRFRQGDVHGNHIRWYPMSSSFWRHTHTHAHTHWGCPSHLFKDPSWAFALIRFVCFLPPSPVVFSSSLLSPTADTIISNSLLASIFAADQRGVIWILVDLTLENGLYKTQKARLSSFLGCEKVTLSRPSQNKKIFSDDIWDICFPPLWLFSLIPWLRATGFPNISFNNTALARFPWKEYCVWG